VAKSKLEGLRVAILATDGFEQSELTEPRRALDAAGAMTDVVSPRGEPIRGWNHKEWGETVEVDETLDDVDPSDYDALLLPGGVMNPDALRMQPQAVAFVKSFFDSGKPVAAICHGPWTLVEADVVRNRHVTSYESIQTDLKNAGAQWSDEAVVVDNGLVTSRKPDDIPQFNAKMIEEFCEGLHPGSGAAVESTPAHSTHQA
jgi:protease I